MNSRVIAAHPVSSVDDEVELDLHAQRIEQEDLVQRQAGYWRFRERHFQSRQLRFFDGSLDYLKEVRTITGLPLLRKDFIFDDYQIYEALAAGADAVLLIAAMLDGAHFNDLLQQAHHLGLDVLVEIHDREELDKVMNYDVRMLGINNRNLRTFSTSLETSLELAADLPDTVTMVSESGIRTRDDIRRLRGAGFSAFLIGEELMRAGDEGAALRDLIRPDEIS